MTPRRLVVDANILVRAVLGRRVREVIGAHASEAEYFVPGVAYHDAERHLPAILDKFGRSGEVGEALAVLAQLRGILLAVPEEFYLSQKEESLARIERRDVEDWPVLALALVLECPIWTEDNDFFGCGVPTWTTDRVERYLRPGV